MQAGGIPYGRSAKVGLIPEAVLRVVERPVVFVRFQAMAIWDGDGAVAVDEGLHRSGVVNEIRFIPLEHLRYFGFLFVHSYIPIDVKNFRGFVLQLSLQRVRHIGIACQGWAPYGGTYQYKVQAGVREGWKEHVLLQLIQGHSLASYAEGFLVEEPRDFHRPFYGVVVHDLLDHQDVVRIGVKSLLLLWLLAEYSVVFNSPHQGVQSGGVLFQAIVFHQAIGHIVLEEIIGISEKTALLG